MHATFEMRLRSSCLVLLSIAAFGGCSTDKKADAAQPRERKEGSVAPRPSVVETPAQPYRATNVVGGARLTGTVEFDGALPPDSVIRLPPETQGCGNSVRTQSIEHTGSRIGQAIVWIADIRTGKPLPVERRFELANDGCLLAPRIQAVLAPATLNVASEDVAMHRNHIIDVRTGELQAIAPFNDNGEVIPFDSLLVRPAQLEVTCEVHPWSKAWILVFDHPYFAMSEKAGTFSIDNIPAGTYTVKAWHPQLGSGEQTVTVAAGQAASLGIKLGAPTVPTPATAQPADSQTK